MKATINRVANKNSIRAEILRGMVDSFFIDFKQQLEGDEYPVVLIRNFGRFKPTLGKVDKHISVIDLKLSREDTPEDMKVLLREKKTLMIALRERILKEKHIRNER
jgi:hypothetical protein